MIIKPTGQTMEDKREHLLGRARHPTDMDLECPDIRTVRCEALVMALNDLKGQTKYVTLHLPDCSKCAKEKRG